MNENIYFLFKLIIIMNYPQNKNWVKNIYLLNIIIKKDN